MRLFLGILPLVLFFSSSAFAGSVFKTNGKKVYIKFSQDDSFAVGDLFYITTPEGKKTGLVLLKKVKGFKAIGVLQKGKATDGGLTVFKGMGKTAKKSKSKSSDDSDSSEDSENTETNEKPRWGIMGGYGIAKQDVTDPTDGFLSAETGSSIALKALYDYPLLEGITLRAMFGAEIFSVSGPSSTNTTIGSDINYAAFDALVKWAFISGTSMDFYLLGGLGIFYPVSSSSTAIDSESISSFAIGEFGLGVQFKSATYEFPLDISYYYFPSGEDVKTNVISVKAGIIF